MKYDSCQKGLDHIINCIHSNATDAITCNHQAKLERLGHLEPDGFVRKAPVRSATTVVCGPKGHHEPSVVNRKSSSVKLLHYGFGMQHYHSLVCSKNGSPGNCSAGQIVM